ncbi:MAG: MTAP family purine nucleoside phosphorylase [Candidatus Heimdallarchaeota archaeon]|nr:MTAP family purine nucleoside phosphorylase [Candidatus Heimdallarchaeota archaeon]
MIGIIGGSGFYDFIESEESENINTPFGATKYMIGNVAGTNVCFLPRHGSQHSIAPSQINYRANIFAALTLGVEYIIATNAVGSLRKEFEPGLLAVPNGILDFTSGRQSTFFDGSNIEIKIKSGKILTGVIHTDVTETLSHVIRTKIMTAATKLGHKIYNGGTIVVSNGPRFETPAEIKSYAILGADFVGMTSAPEVFLARELDIPYASLAVITNYGAGLQNSVNAEEVFTLFKNRISSVKEIIKLAISQ